MSISEKYKYKKGFIKIPILYSSLILRLSHYFSQIFYRASFEIII